MAPRVLAVVPARSGSKGLPGKNIRPFVGIPLLCHSVLCALQVPEITTVVVSTDSADYAKVVFHPAVSRVLGSLGGGRLHGVEVMDRRPDLAQDDTPIWTVLQDVLATKEVAGNVWDFLVLLEVTSPCRKPEWVSGAIRLLEQHESADGVHGVSVDKWNPIWHAMVEKGPYLEYLIPSGRFYYRRQDAPTIWKIDGSLHVWRASFVRHAAGEYHGGKHLKYETDPNWAFSFDELEEFEAAETLVKAGKIALPWLPK